MCQQGTLSGRITFTCTANNDLLMPPSCSISSGLGAPVDIQCKKLKNFYFCFSLLIKHMPHTLPFCTGMSGVPFSVAVPDFVPGVNYTLAFSVTDVFGQTVSILQSFILTGKRWL